VLDVRLKRRELQSEVIDRIYQRMISERRQIASRFRSEAKEKRPVRGQKTRSECNSITAYRQVQHDPRRS